MKLPEGHRLARFDSIDSTNSEAARCASTGESGPLWVFAGEQTAGRGRLGRAWVSSRGNFYATLLTSFGCDAPAAAQLGFVASLAMHDTLKALAPPLHCVLKWPNDILANGAKICGILSEALSQKPLTVAIGWGLNVAHAPEGTPYPAASLASLGVCVQAESVLQELAANTSNRLSIWDEGNGFMEIRHDWLARAAGFGNAVSVDRGGDVLKGVARGLGEDGSLLVETNNGRQIAVASGDVRFAAIEAQRKNR